MLQNCLLAYYKERCHSLDGAFFKAAGYFDPDGVHDLRVEVKQLRAFFRLLGWIAPKFKGKKHIQHFRDLFKAAGDLRDVHVQQELTRKWSKELGEFMNEYYNSLKQKEFPARETFADFTREFDLKKEIAVNQKRISRTLKSFTEEELHEKIEQRITAQLHKILELGAQASDDEAQLHNLRIQSKETRYTLDVAKRCLPESAFWNELNAHLRAIHQTLGKWHDGDVAREHILQFQQECQAAEASRDNTQTDSAIYQQLLQKMQEEKAIHLKNFQIAWAEFLILLEE